MSRSYLLRRLLLVIPAMLIAAAGIALVVVGGFTLTLVFWGYATRRG